MQYRVYWQNIREEYDWIEVKDLLSAKLIYSSLIRADMFDNMIQNFGGIKVLIDNSWKEWVNEYGETILMEVMTLNGYKGPMFTM